MTTFTLQVIDANDDAQEANDGSAFSRAANPLSIQEGATTANQISGGFLFRGVTIPAGATVTSATLSLKEDGFGSAPVGTIIYAEDVDDSADFLATADVISRARTSASVSWTIPGTGGAWNTSGNIASCIQEVVDRAGWVSGNALTVLVIAQSAGSTAAFNAISYDGGLGAGNEAKLEITYTTSGSTFPFARRTVAAAIPVEHDEPTRPISSRLMAAVLSAGTAALVPVLFGAELLRRRKRLEEHPDDERTAKQGNIAALLSPAAPSPPAFTLFRQPRAPLPELPADERIKRRTFAPLESTSVEPPAFTLFVRSRIREVVEEVGELVRRLFPWGTRTGLCTDGLPGSATFQISPRMPAAATFAGSAIGSAQYAPHGTATFEVNSPASATFFVEGC